MGPVNGFVGVGSQLFGIYRCFAGIVIINPCIGLALKGTFYETQAGFSALS